MPIRLHRLAIAALIASLPYVSAHAETYIWTDGEGTTHFTDDPSSIPKKYRKRAATREDDYISQPKTEPAAVSGNNGKQQQPPAVRQPAAAGQPGAASGTAVSEKSADGVYGSRKIDEWRAEFRAREAEYKRCEAQLNELDAVRKNSGGISRDRLMNLPNEFRQAQQKYRDALKRYNDLNDEANKAGLPEDYRK